MFLKSHATAKAYLKVKEGRWNCNLDSRPKATQLRPGYDNAKYVPENHSS